MDAEVESMDHAIDVAGPLAAVEGGLLVPVFGGRRLPGPVRALDEASGGRLSAQLARTGFEGTRGEARLLLDLPGIAPDRILAIGCGERSALDARRFGSIADHAARELARVGAGPFTSCLTLVRVRRRDRHWRLRQLIRRIEANAYRYVPPGRKGASSGGFASDSDAGSGSDVPPGSDAAPGHDAAPRRVSARPDTLVHLIADEASRVPATATLAEALATARGEAFARDLGNRPPADCTPILLGEAARALAERHAHVETEVLDAAGIEREGMGGVLAVARGSAAPPTYSIVRYRHPESSGAPLVLIGKGVTFDSGGLSIKSSTGMQYMKLDMAGAAAVLGAIDAVAELALVLDVVALVPAVENMPGPDALRPGDVVTMMSGRTVEVLNTDAEGRLILADALHHARRFEPAAVLDVATLTGATVGALGRHLTALFTSDRRLERALVKAGRESHDRVWPMPLMAEYRAVLDSKVADLANVGGSSAGAIVAACFLERFARSLHWAHLDIAGVAGRDGSASGRPVPLLVRWLIGNAGSGARS